MSLIEKFVFRPGCCDVIPSADGETDVIGPCCDCGTRQEVTVLSAALENFRAGGFAQDCFPELPAEKREFLISGICGECWDKMFHEEGEDE